MVIMEEEETSIEYIQDIKYENLNLEMIDGAQNDIQYENGNSINSTENDKKSYWSKVREEIPLVLSHRDIQAATDPDNLDLSDLEIIIEKECRARKLMNSKEPWSLWLSRVADWVCLGSTVIIICILLSVLIFYLFKDRERL